jgi:GDPmannose 4,6-dehydratase
MWLMMQVEEPGDYVIGTGTSYSVRDFLTHAFGHVGLDWEEYVRFDERYLRPTEVADLVGDASLAAERLGWQARTHVPELAQLMVDADLRALDRG